MRDRVLLAAAVTFLGLTNLLGQAGAPAPRKPDEAVQVAFSVAVKLRKLRRRRAPIDLTGYWVAVVTEDWRFRMVTPPKGDFAVFQQILPEFRPVSSGILLRTKPPANNANPMALPQSCVCPAHPHHVGTTTQR
jgi:hypothetical protein